MFVFPPRPEKAITPSLIQFYERRGWIAQIKKNGTCTVVSVDAGGNSTFYTRHNEAHKAWTPTSEARAIFAKYPNSTFIFELLHSKGGDVRDTMYIFDVVRFEGESLEGTTLASRLDIIKKAFTPSTKLLVAETYTTGLEPLYRGLTSPLDEGIVLKDPKATLKSCQRDSLNSNWMVKCRRQTKNYGF